MLRASSPRSWLLTERALQGSDAVRRSESRWVALIAAMVFFVHGSIYGQGQRADRSARSTKTDDVEPVVPGRYLRTSEVDRNRTLDEIRKITLASGADLQPVESQHVTLWAARDIQPVFLSDLRKLEKHLDTKCKEPLRSGLDRRTAHILLIRHRYEYERWIAAMFDVMGDRFQQPDNPNAVAELKTWALKSQSYVPQEYAVFCLEGQPVDWAHRVVAVGMGYMMFTQLVASRENSPLATGFANGMEDHSGRFAERHALQQQLPQRRPRPRRLPECVDPPGSATYCDPPGVAGEPPPANGHVDDADAALRRGLESCGFAGQATTSVGEFMLALREDHAAMKAIERIYGWNEKRLTQQWYKHVGRWNRQTADMRQEGNGRLSPEQPLARLEPKEPVRSLSTERMISWRPLQYFSGRTFQYNRGHDPFEPFQR